MRWKGNTSTLSSINGFIHLLDVWMLYSFSQWWPHTPGFITRKPWNVEKKNPHGALFLNPKQHQRYQTDHKQPDIRRRLQWKTRDDSLYMVLPGQRGCTPHSAGEWNTQDVSQPPDTVTGRRKKKKQPGHKVAEERCLFRGFKKGRGGSTSLGCPTWTSAKKSTGIGQCGWRGGFHSSKHVFGSCTSELNY